jgi:hypothetical protein
VAGTIDQLVAYVPSVVSRAPPKEIVFLSVPRAALAVSIFLCHVDKTVEPWYGIELFMQESGQLTLF